MTGTAEEIYPSINPYVSLALSIFLSFQFVGGLYLFSSGNRDNPFVIKRRFQSVFVSCIISYIVLYYLIPQSSQRVYVFLQVIGVMTESYLWGIILPFLLTMLLFSGPLLMAYLDYGIEEEPFDLRWLRNYVVGPTVEEVVYRSAIVPILYYGGYSTRSIIIFSPLLFGLSHLHHIFPMGKKRREIIAQLLVSLLQVLYTSLFGMFTALIFVRTGNLLSCILVHSFCNMMGLPRFQDVPHHPHSRLLSITFVLGLVGFFYYLPLLIHPVYFNSLFI
ncbi:hypothetical protein SAMD00019534_002490 [Acytostelium subglobosum LB1]|uniref:hypothetical protein n=1 Tax=Acytostelium subglobosum LB1 TaxID=1410327 RepID=UPI000644A2FB|nr:hypothetical protein SAMD00019534_002490 [Acytostelium subglobosum LB1]GAM17074.1 hypothetical protein SAMD00019534_002490 [Acytostelium subglobosum LB1]|eukprot:XP_012759136.1 hypothetical protein SAMD00019534_002490 [Acytostelium subglobosum LB1]